MTQFRAGLLTGSAGSRLLALEHRTSAIRSVSGQMSAVAAAPLVDRKIVGRGRLRVGNVPEAVTPREEVRPMNAVRTWVLPLVVTVGRLT
jgi:hypothetical protein